MTIDLTPELEQLVHEKARQSGLDAGAFVAKVLGETLGANGGAQRGSGPALRKRRPISERFAEIRRQAPPEVQQALHELPSDFAAEHDHYLYGTPKKHS